mmetsp:Transcript_16514/g.41210  ORF Transcript_16514/g.41210 Transcript_16514/m.41210 type:complete len:87 (+) Transcript_16514:448-708(+)
MPPCYIHQYGILFVQKSQHQSSAFGVCRLTVLHDHVQEDTASTGRATQHGHQAHMLHSLAAAPYACFPSAASSPSSSTSSHSPSSS